MIKTVIITLISFVIVVVCITYYIINKNKITFGIYNQRACELKQEQNECGLYQDNVCYRGIMEHSTCKKTDKYKTLSTVCLVFAIISGIALLIFGFKLRVEMMSNYY